tara:strand:+ start:623 stop:832 length:210 start_codon:yes stop_codon:yes gene_type:complete
LLPNRYVPAAHSTGDSSGAGHVYPSGHALHTVSPVSESVGCRVVSAWSYGDAVNALAFNVHREYVPSLQ